MQVLLILCAFGLFTIIAYLFHRQRVTSLQEQMRMKEEFLEEAKAHLQDSFRLMSRDAMETSRDVLQEQVGPIREALTAFDRKVQEWEKARVGDYSGLREQIKGLLTAQEGLRRETTNLVSIMKQPHARGQWGEMQLKRVVELAGMMAHVDFVEQTAGEDRRLRPDMVIKLPGGGHIIIDAKAPLSALLEAHEIQDEHLRERKFAEHAAHVKGHIKTLGQKRYWDQFAKAPEFVILFLPGESFFNAALKEDPALLEEAIGDRVLLATPTTLIALLKAVSLGWRQQQFCEKAEEMAGNARELFKRVRDFLVHFNRVGKSLNQAAEAYNGAVGSLEARVMPQAKRLPEVEFESLVTVRDVRDTQGVTLSTE